MENLQNLEDLEALQDAFLLQGDGYDSHLSLNREQFCVALSLVLNKGDPEQYGKLFDKIDAIREGTVDWDKFVTYLLLEFYEHDDRVKSTQVPQWKDLKTLTQSPHKDIIQKIQFLKSISKYIVISKEGCVSMWDTRLELQRSIKASVDSCNTKDLWVTSWVHLHSVNKIALSFTSKEIEFAPKIDCTSRKAIYDLSTKLDFNCQFKIENLEHTPICLDFWSDGEDINQAILTWGDTAGLVWAIIFSTANIALFERHTTADQQDTCAIIQLKHIAKNKYKNAQLLKNICHTEWVRQVAYYSNLECFMSCSTSWNNSMVLSWMEKNSKDSKHFLQDQPKILSKKQINRKSVFQITQGINGFDYHDQLNLIATAGVNHHVCLWNPYVVSKPAGVLRGHMASITQVCFIKNRGQLVSYSKDKVLRIWDIQLQVGIQRLAGLFPKTFDAHCVLYFDEKMNRLFLSFNSELTVLEIKPDVKNFVMSHNKPIVAAMYNSMFNQVVSASQDGTINIWMIDSGQKVKQLTETHGTAELTSLSHDYSESRILTGAADGTIKMWDFNGHCYHTMRAVPDDSSADVGQIIALKRTFIAVGWAKHMTVFRDNSFQDFYVDPSDWKGGQGHCDDILAVAFMLPNILATGSYDGEIVIWNNSTEQISKHLQQRCRPMKSKTTLLMRQGTAPSKIDGGFDSRKWLEDNPPSRPKSRAESRISECGSDESNQFGFAITRLLFINNRPKGVNLLSCGGNGWVRFWSLANSQLVGEFVAHMHVGSIIMAVDATGQWLVTGDMDGMIKVWDIIDYCLECQANLVTEPPRLHCQFQPHIDMICSLEVFERRERILILSASSDCSVQLSDINGIKIGVFGQDTHWRIDPIPPSDPSETKQIIATIKEENKIPEEQIITTSKEENILPEEEDDEPADQSFMFDSNWEPDPRATVDPCNYRINTWQSTYLGKEYQELRMTKRERRQPQVIRDLPYLHWERTKRAPAGPHTALNTMDLTSTTTLEKPDFMYHPHKYFNERLPSLDRKKKLSTESLQAAFDEKTLFPKYILDYEVKMKQALEKTHVNQKKPVKLPMGIEQPTHQAKQTTKKTTFAKLSK